MATPAPSVVQLKPPIRRWRLDCRGCFALWDSDNRLVELRGRKARAILAYLITHPDEHVTRERLIELLWPDRGIAQARGSLRQSLLEIRRIAPDLINSDHDHVWIDSARLSPVEIADHCSPAEQLFDDLDGITPEFDDWLRCERAAEASEEWSELERKAEALLGQGNGPEAVPLIERMQRIDPYNEDWLRLAMRAECQAGHPAGIQTRFRELDELLKCELGVSLSAQTRALHDELLAELSAPVERSTTNSCDARVVPLQQPLPAQEKGRHPWLAVAGIVGLVTTLSLSHSAQTASAEPARIAVLPFHALGGVDSALAEGMAEEVHGDLSQQSGLRTVGRTSSWMFKDKAADLRHVGRRLDVRYIVEGSLRRTGDVLRLNIALIDTRDASTLWSGRFASQSGDVQRLEDAASSAILQRLGIRTAESDRYTNPQAYALYVRAKALLRDRSEETRRASEEFLAAALRIDPKFAPAWAQLATIPRLGGAQREAVNDPLTPGKKLTPRDAAGRALALDPDLAEAHAAIALAEGFNTAKGREHLRRAVSLQPRDPELLFWWGHVMGNLGNFREMAAIYRQAASLDPLWQRPVLEVALLDQYAGNSARAQRYIQTIKAGNPEAGAEVEKSFAFFTGDFSKSVELAFKPREIRWDAGTFTAARALTGLGLTRDGLLYWKAGGNGGPDGPLPDRTGLIAEAKLSSAEGGDWVFYFDTLWGLARERRWTDIAALYDMGFGSISHLANREPSGRADRIAFGGLVAVALKKVGRDREAIGVALATDEAVRTALANGQVPADALVWIAGDEAILGRREAALAHLEQAVNMGWKMHEAMVRPMDLGEDPVFATLRTEPRFNRLQRIVELHKAKERKEIAALNLF